MTNDIAIRYCDEYLARHISDIDKEFLKKAKEALQQEPCEDCISRKAAIDACLIGWNKDYKEIVEEIRTLPPANPQKPKTGHWIWDEKSKVYRCSCCGHFPWRVNTSYQDDIFEDLERTNAYKYCPTCGAKMEEGER